MICNAATIERNSHSDFVVIGSRRKHGRYGVVPCYSINAPSSMTFKPLDEAASIPVPDVDLCVYCASVFCPYR